MAQLKSGRIGVTDFISGTPGTFGNVEQAIADILGVPVDTEITGHVFGDPSEGKGVNATGTIAGFLHFASSNSLSDPQGASGVVFQNSVGAKVYKIANIGDHFGLWEADLGTPTDWTLKLNLDEVAATFIALSDVYDGEGDYTGHAGEFVKVNADEDGLEFGSGGGGADSLADLSDVPAYGSPANDGNYLRLKTPATDGAEWVPGGGSVFSNLSDMDDVENYGSLDANDLQAVLEVENAGGLRWGLVKREWANGLPESTYYDLTAQDEGHASFAPTTLRFFPSSQSHDDDEALINFGSNMGGNGGFSPTIPGLWLVYTQVNVTNIYAGTFKLLYTANAANIKPGLQQEEVYPSKAMATYGTMQEIYRPQTRKLWGIFSVYTPFAGTEEITFKMWWQVPYADHGNFTGQKVRARDLRFFCARIR